MAKPHAGRDGSVRRIIGVVQDMAKAKGATPAQINKGRPGEAQNGTAAAASGLFLTAFTAARDGTREERRGRRGTVPRRYPPRRRTSGSQAHTA